MQFPLRRSASARGPLLVACLTTAAFVASLRWGPSSTRAAEDDKIVHLRREVVVAEPLESGSGFTWTLASRMGQMLVQAEDEYGPRDPSYTPLGVEFEKNGPQVWYPGNRKHVIIQLGTECLTEPRRAIYQLGHEVVHVMMPSGGAGANNLQEGLAEHFTVRYMKREFDENWGPIRLEKGAVPENKAERYAAARDAAAELLRLRPDAVKVMREKDLSLAKVTKEQILEVCPTCPEDLAAFLTAKF